MSEQPQPVFIIEKIYLKDLSLEIPNSPQVFVEREQPKIDISLHNDARALEEGLYEVVVTATVTAKLKDKAVFLVEAAQAGIFQVRNFQQQDMATLLGVTCGNILFPYLRETVSSLVIRGGFPPFFLSHLSFEGLYQQYQQQQQQQQQQAGASPAP